MQLSYNLFLYKLHKIDYNGKLEIFRIPKYLFSQAFYQNCILLLTLLNCQEYLFNFSLQIHKYNHNRPTRQFI